MPKLSGNAISTTAVVEVCVIKTEVHELTTSMWCVLGNANVSFSYTYLLIIKKENL